MKKGMLIASAVASMLALAAQADEKTAPKKDAKETSSTVLCTGVNECKGKGSCHSAATSCAGQNGCKGKGVVKMTEKDCKDKKGTTVAEK